MVDLLSLSHYALAHVLNISFSPDISKVVAVKAVAQKINPTIATFHTSEVRSSKEVRETSKVVFLTPAYTMVPGLVIGLTALDIGGDTIVRATAFASMIQRDRFEIHLDSWHDTKLYGAGCSWLQLEADDKDFQYGSYNTIEDHPSSAEQMCNTRKIVFKRPYASPPQVVVWLTAFALGSGSSWRITSFATDVTAVGFTIHIDTWADSKLYRAAASWIAYPPDRQGVASGNFSTLDLHSWAQPQSFNSAYEAFGNKIFQKPPRTFVALNSLDISHGQGMRLAVKVDNVSAAGMSWHLDSGSDTVLNSAGASYLAFS